MSQVFSIINLVERVNVCIRCAGCEPGLAVSFTVDPDIAWLCSFIIEKQHGTVPDRVGANAEPD